MDIISKLKAVDLGGCGGACFPTAGKWQAVRGSFAVKKYVVCHASEGEPDVKKDGYILANWPEKVIEGMKEAVKFLSERGVKVSGYIFINHEYAEKYGAKLKEIIKKRKAPIEIFIKPPNGGYICGEETTILNAIEGGKAEPRLKPPYPTVSGLWGYPTIINNVETFYHVCRLASDSYEPVRFYTVAGDCANPGVYKMSNEKTIRQVLDESDNLPGHEFFVQVGGGASGEVLNEKQLDRPATGAMSITIYRLDTWEPRELLRKWIGFYMTESCGQCTPCREGTYRLFETVNAPNPDWRLFFDLLDVLAESSFCGLGLSVPIPVRSYLKNVLTDPDCDIDDPDKDKICKLLK